MKTAKIWKKIESKMLGLGLTMWKGLGDAETTFWVHVL